MTDAAIESTGGGEAPWWRRGVIYQIYPRSFQDTNGDGIGDLPGIVRRLDHLAWLGVDAVWISPFYPSPMADFGYDVTDHCAVDRAYGGIVDFDDIVREAHARGIRVIVDYIPNHTSHRHPWFLASRLSREAERRDWYVWRDPAPDGGPPNNWVSAFGGSAWTWDAHTRQYYLHTFLREQPDLNWRNPEVVDAMVQVLRFWLNRGADGVRVDAVQAVIKDEAMRDNPPNPAYVEGRDDPYERLLREHSTDQPGVHEVIARMREVVDGYPGERVLIGEIYNEVERVMAYYGQDGRGVHFPYNFQLIKLPWNARALEAAVTRYESLLPEGAWPNWVLGNHDRMRVASRVGPAQARVAAMLLLTLRGTPTVYYGDEIGMRNAVIPPDRVRDPWELNLPGRGLGRDPVRTPMQWSAEPNAGFSEAEPWLPLAEDWERVNVAAQADEPRSMLALHRALLALRRAEPALALGDWAPVPAAGDVFAYTRTHGQDRLLVALNLGATPASVEIVGTGRLLLSTALDRADEDVQGRLELRGGEGVVVRMEG
ncbi:MAG TPA: alpha-amylase family glycosyl hydrolase [Longimicrobium sp.]|jgi:alpha-glucosidase|uniref:alpha-amylase family glycosyl hydrolase n=1 Tax=Longimicrobium sp. TaxID=2029185 RepID=UPI002EDB95AD